MIPPSSSGDSYNGDGFGGNGSAAGTELLVPSRSTLPADPLTEWSDGSAAWAPDAQHHGINPLEFLSGLQRRWMLALGVSSGLAALTMIAVYFLFPPEDVATAYLRVSPVKPSYIEGRAPRTATPDEVQRTQQNEQAFCKSHDVIVAALRAPAVQEAKIVQENSNRKIDFLTEQLDVGFLPRSDIMQVRLRGENKRELKAIVDEVVRQYLALGVNKERDDLRKKTTELKGIVQRKQTELDGARKSAKEKAATLGVATAANAKVQNELLLYELQKQRKIQSDTAVELTAAESALYLAATELQEFKRRGVTESMIDTELARDPTFAEMKGQVVQFETAYRAQIARLPKGSQPSPSIRQLAQAYQEAQSQVSNYRRQSGQKIRKAFEERMDSDIRLRRAHVGLLQERAKKHEQDVTDMVDEVKKKTSATEELAADEENIMRLVEYINAKSQIIDDWDLENNANNTRLRVELMQEATSPDETSTLRQIMITLGAGLITGCIGLCAVGGWEYLKRRLSSVGDVSKQLGLHLVGTVPALPSRAGATARGITAEQFDALLADSIDSIRTAIIHGAAGEGNRTLMVTSAWDGEGKTTVASQLAASLARCGRRTLLVDADVRNPTLHELFDLPAGVGLCEVLRGAAEPHTAIRATQDGNLWLLSAGEVDHRSIQALENDAIGMLFRELKAEYDFVVVDTAPVLAVADPLLIGQHVDGAIVSARLGYSQRPKIDEAVKRLRAVGITVLGAVVNGTKPAKSHRASDRLALTAAESP
ncbi:MAG: polysaccharide biosynthesis tyrosine autokinase [Pirellulales bacterium]